MANNRNSNSSKQNKQRTPRKSGLSTRITWGVLIIAAAVFTWAMFTPSPNGGDASVAKAGTPEQIARGKALFSTNCAICHGPQARGQDPLNPRGGKTSAGAYLAPALNGTGHAWHHPADALFATIKNGSVASDSPMRGFDGRLGDEEIRNILGYLFSLWPPNVQARYR
ncbi:MAG: cytochrome c [SAR324 cluster bacterium]|nr:cytochrome c [SAR324 cluster bacterium]